MPAGPAQNWAMFDWSCVRVVLVAEPISFTWLNAAVYSALSKAGGPSGFRNWEGLVMAHGVTLAHCGAAAASVRWRSRSPFSRLRSGRVWHDDAGAIVCP